MDDFTVDPAALAGFELDLQDFGTNFSANAARLLAAVRLPPGSTGLMATLAPSFDNFRAAVSAAQRTDLTTIGHLGANVASAGTTYQSTDDLSAKAISAVGSDVLGGSAAGSSPAARGVSRFGGVQLPRLPEVPENPCTVRQVVDAAIAQIAVYDERFEEAIGVKPAADHLAGLVADWEALQAVGKRIGLLGTNDHITSENVVNGSTWLRSAWSGDASRTFGASADALGRSIAERGDVLDRAAKVVESGGACLERLAYNQAVGLTSAVLRPMTYFGATFPLGAWVPYIHRPIDQAMRSEIVSAADDLKKSAESRHSAMTAVVEAISRALEYTPGRTPPSFDEDDFRIEDRVAADPGVRKYGFGDNTWWEEGIDFVR
ncbi:hypothetical protein ADK67_37065 [Saccharothrix sp. NRRL B-16348]|uniref:hypothetical protein n=1 Tax=Saccharothrix sp. NRRL B-16348 TaxID=1415542 RepID=UPI0006AF0BA9|nr:hypothetical protein [Saccharothrix sp. NRRL B-16348]KOX18407.1 hypothetical protein ADK67_37065 [Saccharothrix sp. NRRL B-16348]